MSDLPSLAKSRWKAYLTIRKGVNVANNGISLQRQFKEVVFEKDLLTDYVTFFDFPLPNPFTSLYLVAQRAQLVLMLDKAFTIAIPGMIHVNNELVVKSPIDYTQPFDIHAQLSVDYKSEGSVFPIFEVKFMQYHNEVAVSRSTYLAKRRRNVSTKRREKSRETEIVNIPDRVVKWDLSGNLGKKYGRVSGDKNPIHTSKFLAKIFGFKRPIIQGWYTVSRVLRESLVEYADINRIDATFVKPIFLPSKVQMELSNQIQSGTGLEVPYVVRSISEDKIYVRGSVFIN